jgi:hypothetical protein
VGLQDASSAPSLSSFPETENLHFAFAFLVVIPSGNLLLNHTNPRQTTNACHPSPQAEDLDLLLSLWSFFRENLLICYPRLAEQIGC